MRQRARDLGITVGPHPTGTHNAITDVPGVRVGHATVREPPRVHTGVTAVVPDAVVTARRTLPCGLFVGNGFGKLIGATQIVELGTIDTPILLTSTLSAFRVADGLVSWMLERPGHEQTRTLNPVVGETNDGFLSDIRARPISEEDVRHALDTAAAGPVTQGCVGAGAGTTALGFKGGIGTSSRRAGDATIGVLVQSNFSGTLTVLGHRVPAPVVPAEAAYEGNSCMIVVATDAPLDARQLSRLARRAVFAMGRVGADFSGGSGDYALAFSTSPGHPAAPEPDLEPFFAAVMDASEEALLDSVLTATTTAGHRGTAHEIAEETLQNSLSHTPYQS